MSKEQKCKKCGSTNFRVPVYQSVDAKLYENGRIDTGFDFTDPDAEKEKIFCDECGENVNN
jgi:hypothetical protein